MPETTAERVAKLIESIGRRGRLEDAPPPPGLGDEVKRFLVHLSTDDGDLERVFFYDGAETVAIEVLTLTRDDFGLVAVYDLFADDWETPLPVEVSVRVAGALATDTLNDRALRAGDTIRFLKSDQYPRHRPTHTDQTYFVKAGDTATVTFVGTRKTLVAEYRFAAGKAGLVKLALPVKAAMGFLYERLR